MADKTKAEYQDLLKKIDCASQNVNSTVIVLETKITPNGVMAYNSTIKCAANASHTVSRSSLSTISNTKTTNMAFTATQGKGIMYSIAN